jgi:hypothetical protein
MNNNIESALEVYRDLTGTYSWQIKWEISFGLKRTGFWRDYSDKIFVSSIKAISY